MFALLATVLTGVSSTIPVWKLTVIPNFRSIGCHGPNSREGCQEFSAEKNRPAAYAIEPMTDSRLDDLLIEADLDLGRFFLCQALKKEWVTFEISVENKCPAKNT